MHIINKFIFALLLASTLASAQPYSLEYKAHHEEANSELKSDNVIVIYSMESNDQLYGVKIDAEITGLLEKNFRNGMLEANSQLLKNKNFSSKALPKVTNSRLSSIDYFNVPVGIATVWLSSKTSEGEMHSKYIFAAGIIGNTLHKVICFQLNGDDLTLMVTPKCHDKLKEVYWTKN